MLSKAAQYAIRATSYLAKNSDKVNRINAKQISEETDIPFPFLAKLLQQLSKANLISSIKGPKGGFYLSEKNKKNTLWDIIKIIDGEEKFSNCFLGMHECNIDDPCIFHHIVVSFRTQLLDEFRNQNFSSIIEKNK